MRVPKALSAQRHEREAALANNIVGDDIFSFVPFGVKVGKITHAMPSLIRWIACGMRIKCVL